MWSKSTEPRVKRETPHGKQKLRSQKPEPSCCEAKLLNTTSLRTVRIQIKTIKGFFVFVFFFTLANGTETDANDAENH